MAVGYDMDMKTLLSSIIRWNSLGRSVIYTLGHVIIASVCNVYITGAVMELAITDAIIEPMVNMIWYYVLDVCYSRYVSK